MSNKKIVYRVRLMYYEEFCGCFGESTVFEEYFENELAAKKKIQDTLRILKRGYYMLTDRYRLEGDYRESFVGLRKHFGEHETNPEAVLIRRDPYHDTELLHIALLPEKIVIDDSVVTESDMSNANDGYLLYEDESGVMFKRPDCDLKTIADVFNLECDFESDRGAMYSNEDIMMMVYSENIQFLLSSKCNKTVLAEFLKEYFEKEKWKYS